MFGLGSLFQAIVPSSRIAALVGSGLLLLVPTQARADKVTYPPESRNYKKILDLFQSVVAQPSQSTVCVRCGQKQVALGTIVAPDGWILTKHSELSGPVTCLLTDGQAFSARVVGVHEPYDLALLKVDASNLKAVQWGDIKSATVGNFVATPGQGTNPEAIGVVSVASRLVTAFDMPLSDAYLGVRLQVHDRGVKIDQVEPGSGAFRAGFKVGDVVVAVAGQTVSKPEKLIEVVQRYKIGDEVVLKIVRGDEQLELKAILGKRPGMERSQFQNRLGNTVSKRSNGFPSILQHDTVLTPDQCGGPLVDLNGKTIGINIARAGRVETYAVPADVVLSLLPDLKSGKLPPAEVREAEESVAAARKVLARAEAALKEAQKRARQTKLPAEGAEAEVKEAEKRVQDAKSALEKAEKELKALK
jgi:serine protease Do